MFIPPMGFLFVHLFPLSSKYVLFLSGFDVICTVIVLFCVFLHRNMDICLYFIIPSIVGCVNDVRCLFFYRICYSIVFQLNSYFQNLLHRNIFHNPEVQCITILKNSPLDFIYYFSSENQVHEKYFLPSQS